MLALTLILVCAISLLAYLRHVFTFWSRRGFPCVKPKSLLGCLGPVAFQKKSLGELVRNLQLQGGTEPFLGLYFLHRPTLMVRHPELLKRILVSDFDHFMDRGTHYDEENDPIGAHLFSMPGQRWKELRAKFTPTFSSAKLKFYFQRIAAESETLKTVMDANVDNAEGIRLKNIMVKTNMNIIASCFFGFELNSYKEPNHPFVKIGDTFMDHTIMRNNVVMFLTVFFPELMKHLKIPFLSRDVSQYVMATFNSVYYTRKNDPTTKRADFIQTVLDMVEEGEGKVAEQKNILMCAAQAFIFYIAGYETSATTVSFCMYELSKSPQWMAKVREEVDALMEKRKGQLQFEDMNELKVLDQCIKETLRMYPPVPFLNRVCTKEYKIPDTELVVPKGVSVLLPIWGLQMDPRHFPNPETFDPERFRDEGSEERPYYPLGFGPRYCIGARLGFIMAKMALCTLIHNYDFEAVDKFVTFLQPGIIVSDVNQCHLKVTKRQSE